MSPSRRIITVLPKGGDEVEVLEKEKEEEQIADEKMVNDAAEWIRDTLSKTLYKAGTDVGEYVLEKFFEGDSEKVRERSPYKNASFRKLAELCGTPELPISRSWLHNAVSVAVMERLLPRSATAFRQLPPTHKVTLLPLHDPSKVERIAQRAINKKMSVRELKAVVVEEAPKFEKDPRGRKPKPLIIKTLSRSVKLFTLESGRKSFRKADIEKLSDADKKVALKNAKDLITSLTNLVEKLGGQ